MSYSPRFRGRALEQLQGLPPEAFDALVARVAELVDEPWDAAVAAPGDDPASREAVFGAGRGFLSFRADDAAEEIEITYLTWIG